MGIYNGCGGDGGMKFGEAVRVLIPLLPKFQQAMALRFWQGVEIEVCKPHDGHFYIGGGIIAYIIATALFTYRLCIKLRWTKLRLQILSFPVVFIGMFIGGIEYFNWCLPWNKKTLPVNY